MVGRDIEPIIIEVVVVVVVVVVILVVVWILSVSMTLMPTLWTVLQGGDGSGSGSGIGFGFVERMFFRINLRCPNVVCSGSVKWRRTRGGDIPVHTCAKQIRLYHT